MSSSDNPGYWFPARRYGWGFPSAWQGGVVLVAYLALVLGGIPLIQAAEGNVVCIA